MTKYLGIVQELLESPSWKLLGIKLENMVEGKVTLSFDVQEQFLQSYNYLQGGFLFTLLDACGAAAVCPLVFPKKAVTLEAKINYLKSVSKDTVFGEAEVIHHGNTTVVTTLRAYDINHKNLAIGTATFSIL